MIFPFSRVNVWSDVGFDRPRFFSEYFRGGSAGGGNAAPVETMLPVACCARLLSSSTGGTSMLLFCSFDVLLAMCSRERRVRTVSYTMYIEVQKRFSFTSYLLVIVSSSSPSVDAAPHAPPPRNKKQRRLAIKTMTIDWPTRKKRRREGLGKGSKHRLGVARRGAAVSAAPKDVQHPKGVRRACCFVAALSAYICI